MQYKLKDLQGAGMKEGLVFDTKTSVRNHLYDFHRQDTELTGEETLNDLLELGGWELIEVKK